MASLELATAYISLSASARGLRKDIDKELGAVGRGVEAKGSGWGKKITGGLTKAVKVGGVAAGAALATTLAKGLGRLTAIETAQAKLRGLGHDAGSVDKIMANALASVKGTAFGLGEAATTAAGAVAAGIKPGKDLEGVLKSVANSAAAAGVGMDEMGGIYNKVASLGKAQNDSLQQVADKGIPIYQALAEQMGVTSEEIFKMASEGKVSFEDFEKAMTSASGTVADEMGKTFTGSLQNAWAAVGRLGASLLGGVFDKLGPAVQDVTGWIDKMGPVAERVGSAIGTAVDWAADAVGNLVQQFKDGEGAGGRIRDVLSGIGDVVKTAFGWVKDNAVPAVQDFVQGFKDGEGPGGKLRDVLSGIGDVAKQVFTDLRDNFLPPVKDFIQQFRDGEGAGGKFRDVLSGVGDKIKDAFGYVADNVVPALEDMYQWVKDNKDTLIVLGAAVLGYKAGVAGATLVTKGITAATKIWTAVQKGLNLVMKMNPVGLVVAAIAALIAIVIIAYQRNEKFRKVVDKAWAAIKTAISGVVNWFKNTAWPWMRDAFQKIGDKASWLWQNAIKPAWDKIKSGVSTVVSWVRDTAWPWMRDAFSKMATKAGDIKDKIVGAWDKLRSGISSGWDKIKGVFDKFKSGLSSLRDRFRSVRDGIGQIWGTLTRAVARPIRAVLEFVNDKFLGRLQNALNKIPGVNVSLPRIPVPALPSTGATRGAGSLALAMAAGGVVPGFSPHARADNIPAMLTAGEFVLPVGATKRLMSLFGPGGMEALRRGLPGFASGGPVGGARGGGLGATWEWLTDVFSDAKGWVKKKIDGFLSAIGDSWPAQAVLGVAGKVASGIGTWLKEKLLGSSVDGQGNVVGGQHVNYGGRFGWAPSGLSWPTLWAMTKMVAPEAVLTSSYRPGAITASGIPSLHGMGRAIDVVSGDMMSTFLKMRAAFGGFASQLYYTPAGGLQIGYRDATVAATHRDHIHFGYAQGGLVRRPFVADAGAVLRPGINVLDNRTGGPEPLGRLDKPLALAQADLDYLADRINDGALRAALRGAEKQARLERAR